MAIFDKTLINNLKNNKHNLLVSINTAKQLLQNLLLLCVLTNEYVKKILNEVTLQTLTNEITRLCNLLLKCNKKSNGLQLYTYAITSLSIL